MRLRVEIEVGNAAMQTRADLRDALREVAEELDVYCDDAPEVGTYGRIVDANGNRVGRWEVVP